MGWSFIENTTRRDVIEMLIKDESNQGYRWKTLKNCTRGNVLWTITERTHGNGDEVIRFIGCHLLQRSVETRYGRKVVSWGYKSMDESVHPYYYSCPLSYLNEVPTECEEWREKVRLYHHRYRIGDRLALVNCKVGHLVVTSLKPLVGKAHDGARYRVPRDRVVQVN
jgi:hypothetical protein